MAMKRWIGPTEIASLTGENRTTIYRLIERGDFEDVLSTVSAGRRKWCAEAIWRLHLTGTTEGCKDLDDIRSFVAEYPMPDDAPGESRMAS